MGQHGKRRHYVTIQKRTNARDPESRELYPENDDRAWEDYAIEVPGELAAVGGVGGGGERIRNVQMEAGEDSFFITQYRDDISPLMRIIYNGRILNVKRVFDRFGKRREIIIGLREVTI